MPLWLVRAGKYGEHEQHFLDTNRVYLTWSGLHNTDLTKANSYEDIKAIVRNAESPDATPGKIANNAGQVSAFVLGMNVGDWLVLPLKMKSAIAVGEIKSNFTYDANAEPPFPEHSLCNRKSPLLRAFSTGKIKSSDGKNQIPESVRINVK